MLGTALVAQNDEGDRNFRIVHLIASANVHARLKYSSEKFKTAASCDGFRERTTMTSWGQFRLAVEFPHPCPRVHIRMQFSATVRLRVHASAWRLDGPAQ